MNFTAHEVAAAGGGRVLHGPSESQAEGLCIDTRLLRPGQAFAAVPGSRVDGHDFCFQALESGAVFVIVQKELDLPEGKPQVVVEDTTRALADLVRHLRAREALEIVGVTGSAGKTTTKTLAAAALGVEASPGNYNTVYGIALALGNLASGTKRVVLEMGISQPGEMAVLADMVRPDVMILTNVAPAHIEFFRDLQELAAEKASSLGGLRPGGGAVWNGDDRGLEKAVLQALPEGSRKLRFGTNPDAGLDILLQDYRMRDLGTAQCRVRMPDASSIEFELRLSGRHNALNAMAALGAGWLLEEEADLMAQRLGRVGPVEGRGRILQFSGMTILDESYNANPRAMQAALDSLVEICERQSSPARRIAVLGDMLELGEESAEHHRRLGRASVEAGLDLLVGIGPAMKDAVEAAREDGLKALHYPDSEVAGRELAQLCRPGDVILVKGSRSVGTETVIQRLQGREEES